MRLRPATIRIAHLRSLQVLLILAIMLTAFSFVAQGQQPSAREIVFPVSLQWPRQKDVSRYRLQIAADEKFQNVFIDRRVVGDRYLVSELSPGHYYWRVAAAELQLGEFSRPTRFFISGGAVVPVKLTGRASRATRSHSSPPVTSRSVRPKGSLQR